MSQRILVTDDHDQTEIPLAEANMTLTTVTLTRNGYTFTWDSANLTTESWDALVKVARDFFPNMEPIVNDGYAKDSSEAGVLFEETTDALRAELDTGKRASDLIDAAAEARQAAPAAAPKPAPAKNGKRDSRAVRAWWYALDAKTLTALKLPTPKDRNIQIGKLPQIVNDIYDQAHS